ncbi:MAG: nucleoside phosphorylase, partial [Acidimicrobiia bacterium]|nr:nucleoside phosphorylase [Acidimicrobiia bacterium]
MDLFDNTAGNVGKMQYHLRVKPGDVADYVLLPGDPGRVLLIAEHIDEPKEVAYHREYRTVTGAYQGIPVSGTSTGIGCPSASIAVEELANVGVSHFIRVGSSAAFVPGVRKGDILINVASMREDGTTAALVDNGFPAVADHFLTAA